MLRALFTYLIVAFTYTASAQTVDPDRLEALARQAEIEKAREVELGKSKETVRQQIKSLRKDLIKVAGEAQAYEKTGREIERKLADLNVQKTTLKTNIYKDRKALAKLLGALQRVEANPPPALAISPQDAADAVRAAKLMSSMSQGLKFRSEALAKELETLAVVQSDIEKERDKLKTNETLLAKKRERTKKLVAQKGDLEKSISSDQADTQKRVAALAAEADSLRDLIRRFEQSTRSVVPRLKPDKNTKPSTVRRPSTRSTPRPSGPLVLPPNTRSFASSKGRLKPPVRGRLSKSYTKSRKGLTVSTRAKAQVVAPHTGRVEFAGPFKNYENVVILNMGDGYFMLLTGLGEVYAKADEVVIAGEPIGLMPFNTQGSKDLYIEIRKDGAAINPTPWLGTSFAG